MNADFYRSNRRALAGAIQSRLIVISAFSKMQGSVDGASVFEQESNFLWLTGISAPDWWLIVDSAKDKSWLVYPELSKNQQLFDGSLSHDTANSVSGVDGVMSKKEALALFEVLKSEGYPAVHTLEEPRHSRQAGFVLNPAPRNLRKVLKKTFPDVIDCRRELLRLRAIKQPVEIEAMRSAAKLTIESFREVKSKLLDFHYEYEIEAELTYRFRRGGAFHAFEPIVAAGKNACTLHYVDNTDGLDQIQLILIDAGARVSGYPADITRTYIANKPTDRQLAVHAAVQSAERQIIESLKPGLLVSSYIESIDIIMKDVLLSLGLIKNRKDEKAYRRYFPHAISHGLGLDVHESLGGFEGFQPGMVLTVEPGIYIPEENIGVRIEDDILITENGFHNLTGELSTDP